MSTKLIALREFRSDDLDALAAMVGDEEQMRFYPRPKTREEASDWIDRNLALYAGRGFGIWLIESVPAGAFLGYCGIRPLELDGRPEIEIGWHTLKSAWNRGIATHAASAARDLAFERFGVQRLVALIHPDHVASRRVAEKIGMDVEGAIVLEEDYPAVIYAATASRERPASFAE